MITKKLKIPIPFLVDEHRAEALTYIFSLMCFDVGVELVSMCWKEHQETKQVCVDLEINVDDTDDEKSLSAANFVIWFLEILYGHQDPKVREVLVESLKQGVIDAIDAIDEAPTVVH